MEIFQLIKGDYHEVDGGYSGESYTRDDLDELFFDYHSAYSKAISLVNDFNSININDEKMIQIDDFHWKANDEYSNDFNYISIINRQIT